MVGACEVAISPQLPRGARLASVYELYMDDQKLEKGDYYAVTAVDSCRTDAERYAQEAKVSKDEAATSAASSLKEAHRAQAIVDGMDATVLHFETCVVQKTEQLANKVGQDAVACIKQAETTALEAIDTRASEELAEISRLASQACMPRAAA